MQHFIQTPQIKASLGPQVSLSTLEESVTQTIDSLIITERWLEPTLSLWDTSPATMMIWLCSGLSIYQQPLDGLPSLGALFKSKVIKQQFFCCQLQEGTYQSENTTSPKFERSCVTLEKEKGRTHGELKLCQLKYLKQLDISLTFVLNVLTSLFAVVRL